VSEGPVRATLTMWVEPADCAAFVEQWQQVARWTGGWSGCLRQALCREPERVGEDQAVFTITSDWVSEAAFRSFERDPGQEQVTAGLRRLRRSARMSLSGLVAHLPGDAGAGR
jgi:quinol monooxygenase YgiN